MSPILTLTTDFGLRDAYVPAMKGVVLGICPDARLVDISHDISPQDIMEAAFVLRQALPHFPAGSIHVVVVDPGVGTRRRPLAMRWNGQLLVGPDNGLFSLLLGEAEPEEIVMLDRPAFWRTAEPSDTFHGRDIFAPVAAHLAAGRTLRDVGSPTGPAERLHWAVPVADEDGVQGWVVHVDRFGNCITNIPRSFMEPLRNGRKVKSYAGPNILRGLHRTYAEVAAGEPVVLYGSSGYLEIAVNAGSAAELLDIRRGIPVQVTFIHDGDAGSRAP